MANSRRAVAASGGLLLLQGNLLLSLLSDPDAFVRGKALEVANGSVVLLIVGVRKECKIYITCI